MNITIYTSLYLCPIFKIVWLFQTYVRGKYFTVIPFQMHLISVGSTSLQHLRDTGQNSLILMFKVVHQQ